MRTGGADQTGVTVVAIAGIVVVVLGKSNVGSSDTAGDRD